MMGINNFNLTPRAKKVYKCAKQFAIDNAHKGINNAHIFYGCLQNLSEDLIISLEISDINIESINNEQFLIDYFKSYPQDFVNDFEIESWEKEANDAICYAQKLSEVYEHDYIGIEHILYSILENSQQICSFLSKKQIDVDFLKALIKSRIEHVFQKEKDKEESQKELEDSPNNQPSESKKNNAINLYCSFLNMKAANGEFNFISERNQEINEVIEIISKKTKSNAILIGQAGVGKTAIIEGLAQKIVDQDVPINLLNLKIYSVDLGSMIAGTRYRGDFENRLKSLINEAEQNEDIILFFDEIHNIVGAGSSEGSLDASNILKPALARGSLKCIGATTTEEYKKYFEKDTAIKRRFDSVLIEAPSKEQTVKMVENCVGGYEKFHNVIYSPEIINLIIQLCDKHIPHKNFPDKAFDIIDLVGAQAKIRSFQIPKKIKNLRGSLQKMLEDGHQFDDEEKSQHCQDLLIRYITELKSFHEKLLKKKISIKTSDVFKIISEKTGLSKDSISVDSNDFVNFQVDIEKEVFGQSENIEKITDILSCAKVGLNDSNKPLASLFFVGPTSVGKTHTAKKIAKHFYGNEKAIIQINMSEYQDKIGMSKLIGASAGYVGFEQGGLLTEFVRNNPSCVVLFDEVEKCDPEILNLLLHLLDEGYVNDNRNNKISFTRCVVILTSNIGSKNAEQASIGFINDHADKKKLYKEEVKKYLKPEFVARINSIVVFDDLKDEEFEKIIRFEISQIQQKLKKQNISIDIDQDIVKFILNSLKSQKMHARNIKDIIKDKLHVPISKFIIQNSQKSNISAKIVDKSIDIGYSHEV
jgi:ATP-dependent Clp protease ATP-binding subunit ClpC